MKVSGQHFPPISLPAENNPRASPNILEKRKNFVATGL
jgi:hypothetical protein